MRGIACQYRNYGRQIGTGAVPSDRDASRITAELDRVQRNPFQRSFAILNCRRKLGFGCQAIIDRYHDAICLVRQHAAYGIVGVDRTNHEAATVEPHQHG